MSAVGLKGVGDECISRRDRYSRISTKDCIAGRENLLKSCHNNTRAATISPLINRLTITELISYCFS